MRETQKIHIDAKKNKDIALKAEKSNYWEVATSRYYYELFLLITIFLKGTLIPSKKEFISNNPNMPDVEKKGSHEITIFTFLKKIIPLSVGENPVIDILDLKTLNKLMDLKDLRNDYEYFKNYKNKDEFENEFKENYLEVLSVLKTITGYKN